MAGPLPHHDPEDYFAPTRMSLGMHLEDLRRHLWRACAGLGLIVAGCFLLDLLGYLTETPVGIGKPMVDLICLPVEQELKSFQDRRFRQALHKLKAGQGPAGLETAAELDVAAVAREIAPLLGLPTPSAGGPGLYRPVRVRLRDRALDEVLREVRPVLERPARLATMSVTEGMTVYFKVTLVCGVVLASPWVFWQIWSFVAAGLYPHEKRQVLRYLPVSLALFLGGVLLCQFLVIPRAVEALLGFNEWLGLEPELRLSEWLGFTLLLPLVFGISFQTPVVMLALHRLGVLTVESYRGKRRVAWFLLAVFAAIITPSVDVYSMLFLWVPLGLLYELGIALCRLYPGPPQGPCEEWAEAGDCLGV
jgi:sec-independent protein translocase protein TatC